MSEFCKGTLRTIQVKDTDSAIRYGWKVILIARAPGPLQKLVDDGRLEHKPELSPSPRLLAKVNKLKKDGSWNMETFKEEFVPAFLEETEEKQFRDALNEIYGRVMNGENIALTCFCKDSEMCHRSIVTGLLQAAGLNSVGPDYSPYWLLRRIRSEHKPEQPVQQLNLFAK